MCIWLDKQEHIKMLRKHPTENGMLFLCPGTVAKLVNALLWKSRDIGSIPICSTIQCCNSTARVLDCLSSGCGFESRQYCNIWEDNGQVVYPPWTREVAGSNPASQTVLLRSYNGLVHPTFYREIRVRFPYGVPYGVFSLTGKIPHCDWGEQGSRPEDTQIGI